MPLSPTFRALPRRVVVAVPARNEATRLPGCLAALARARCHAALGRVAVRALVLINNSCDASAEVARSFARTADWLRVEVVTLPPALAHAGGARAAAMEIALAGLGPADVLMTTDADSQVAPDWIAANLLEIDHGADAVAGTITLSAAERARLPAMPGRTHEWELAQAQARLERLLDPVSHDPWPRHIWAWGASMALTVAAYRRCGGLPLVPLAEDRALAAALERADCRLRRSLLPRVQTSARLAGRAPGGFADLIRGFAENPDMACDAALEPTRTLVCRAMTRAQLRAAIGGNGFGQQWATMEAADPLLRRQRVAPSALAGELRLARRWISRLSAHPDDNQAFAAAA